MRSFLGTEFTTQRLVQAGNKSSYGEHISGEGHLRQLDEKTASINNIQIGEGWKLIVEGDTDIVTTDKVIINEESYEVRGTRRETFKSLDYLEVLLVKKKA